MKLKQTPDDFRVEELTDVAPGGGEFSLYRLDKTGWTTPDAISAVRRRWQLDARRVSYGGLKDRHAVTSQHLTVWRGPPRGLQHERVTLTYLGQVQEPFTAAGIRANRFTITLRSLDRGAIERAEVALTEVADAGLPNYFDDQRFGSVGDTGEFVAKEMVFGRFERALWLALAAPYEFDRAEAKREKQQLRDGWGDWPKLKAKLPKGHARSLVDYLVHHPTDFKGAVARLRPELQGLYLAAYQSMLWNRMLAAWLTRQATELATVELKLGRVPVPRRAPGGEWETLTLPLPSARMRPQPGEEWAELAAEVLAAEGLTLPELKVKGLQKPFFSKGDRAGCVRPEGLCHSAGADERNAGRVKLELRFDLPRGSYATMLVKRVTEV
ncbi:tRNA pseudouridine(13) synthase TruD [Urbifossiella limnaea]|uniref:tRNA pseudouridine synthase D n=1 Tax=Urbifossiella limnaea TaxID=2528023 RepID=A0A517XXC4_9BACT|nr:tRNA pseudouridine(13) synthase TruD [Urbifossiella limnaea]QDU22169.1 tRNA pseudouridine synthase D [Urbifossiella limnaea]